MNKRGRPTRHAEKLKKTSFKVSDEHKFALRFIARTQHLSDGEALERAVEMFCDSLHLSRSWRELWDAEESVRTLALWGMPEFRPTTIERDRYTFIVAHAQFFYSDKARTVPHRARALILWQHIDEMELTWRTTKQDDYHGAAKEMARLLRKAKLDPPAFG